MKFLPLFVAFAFFFSNYAVAQTTSDTSFRVFGLPVVFFTPDTKWGFGAGGISTFYTPESPQRSSVTFSFAYTQRKQILAWFPYQIYFGKGKYLSYGELGWYRFVFQFFGVGNEFPDDFLESYTARFPRFRGTFLKNIGNGNAVGVRMAYDDFKITEYDSSGILLQKTLKGWDGGRSSGLGAVWWTDTRDNRFYASKGWFVEAAAYFENAWTASNFNFFRLSFEATKYLTLNPKTTFAGQAAGIATYGTAPFFNLATLGGTKRLRGYFDGKYRDDHLFLLQGELRRELFWRIGAVAFAGVGTVFGSAGEMTVWRPNVGAGLRFQFDKKQKLNIRADYGWGSGANRGFYLTVGEAF